MPCRSSRSRLSCSCKMCDLSYQLLHLCLAWILSVNFKFCLRAYTLPRRTRCNLKRHGTAAKAIIRLYNSIKKQFSIFPNPANSLVSITADAVIEKLTITDVKGSLVFNKSIQARKANIDVSSFAKGVYLVQILSKNSASVQQLIID